MFTVKLRLPNILRIQLKMIQHPFGLKLFILLRRLGMPTCSYCRTPNYRRRMHRSCHKKCVAASNARIYGSWRDMQHENSCSATPICHNWHPDFHQFERLSRSVGPFGKYEVDLTAHGQSPSHL